MAAAGGVALTASKTGAKSQHPSPSCLPYSAYLTISIQPARLLRSCSRVSSRRLGRVEGSCWLAWPSQSGVPRCVCACPTARSLGAAGYEYLAQDGYCKANITQRVGKFKVGVGTLPAIKTGFSFPVLFSSLFSCRPKSGWKPSWGLCISSRHPCCIGRLLPGYTVYLLFWACLFAQCQAWYNSADHGCCKALFAVFCCLAALGCVLSTYHLHMQVRLGTRCSVSLT